MTRWDVSMADVASHYMPAWSLESLSQQILSCAGCDDGADCGVGDMWDPGTFVAEPSKDPLKRSPEELAHEVALIHTAYASSHVLKFAKV